jgi:hypothetical protein
MRHQAFGETDGTVRGRVQRLVRNAYTVCDKSGSSNQNPPIALHMKGPVKLARLS